jgi:hypothetical protein
LTANTVEATSPGDGAAAAVSVFHHSPDGDCENWLPRPAPASTIEPPVFGQASCVLPIWTRPPTKTVPPPAAAAMSSAACALADWLLLSP